MKGARMKQMKQWMVQGAAGWRSWSARWAQRTRTSAMA